MRAKIFKRENVLLLCTLINSLGAFVFPFIAIYFSSEKKLSIEVVGTIAAVAGFGLFLGNYFCAYFTRRLGTKTTITSALIINMIGYGSLIFNFEHLVLYPILIFVGVFGAGLLNPSINVHLSSTVTNESRSLVFSIKYMLTNIGLGLGPLIGGLLISISYKLLFILDVLSTGVCLILVIKYLEHTPQVATSTETISKKSFINGLTAHPVVFIITSIGFFIIAPLFALEYSMPLLMKNFLQLSELEIGLTYTINCTTVILFSIPLGKIQNHLGHIKTLFVSAVIISLGLFIITTNFSILYIYIGTFIWALGEVIYFVTMPTFISSNASKENCSYLMSLHSMTNSLSRMIFPLFLSSIWFIGPKPILWVVLSFPVFGALACLTIYLLRAKN